MIFSHCRLHLDKMLRNVDIYRDGQCEIALVLNKQKAHA
jgi:hypothetical protein